MNAGFLASLLLFFFALPAWALDPARDLTQYHHRVFAPQGSARTQVTSVVQNEGGYLWVGTYAGLYRFDGAVFELVSALGGRSIAHQPVTFLFVDPGGGLWIGYSGGAGAGYYKDGRYTSLDPEHGWNSLISAATGLDGVTWAVLNRKLVRLDGTQWTEVPGDEGIGRDAARQVIVDKAGVVWVSTTGEQDLRYLPRGGRRFLWSGTHMGSPFLAVAPGNVVVAAASTGLRTVSLGADKRPLISLVTTEAFSNVLVDRDGGVFANAPGALLHAASVQALAHAGDAASRLAGSRLALQAGGPATAVAWSMLEDREGNVWVATNAALERFRDSQFAPVRIPGESFAFTVAPDADGGVWAANWNSGLLRIDQRSGPATVAGVGPHISCLYRDPTGTLWAAGPTGLWKASALAGFEKMPIAESLLQPWVSTMSLDAAGSLWVLSNTLVRGWPERGVWQAASPNNESGGSFSSRTVMADAAGRLWMADGMRVVRFEQGRYAALPQVSSALRVGAIQTFFEHGDHVWVGGLDGLAVVRKDRVTNLHTRDGPNFTQVIALTETSSGDLWIRGVAAAWHATAEQVREALEGADGQLAAERFDELDGLDATGMSSKWQIAEAGNGTLWFGTSQGLAWIDPKQPRLRGQPPLRHIRTVSVDGQAQDFAAGLSLPPRAHHLEIEYTAVDLGYADRLQFRYRLEGIDRDWQQAGARRVAIYNDLPPGDYRFIVRSTDRDGAWRDEPQAQATLAVHVAAAWFQTLWFKAACLLSLVAAATLAYRLRVRHLDARMALRLRQQLAEGARVGKARQAERDRIARELHDTLLQGLHVVVWKVQALAERMSSTQELRAGIESALATADRVLLESRDRVSELRERGDGNTHLVDEIRDIGDELCAPAAVEFAASVDGKAVLVPPRVHVEVIAIATEAVRNACRHARARRVDLHLHYGMDSFQMVIRDDGAGIPDGVLADGKAGHWGIVGMKERAAGLNGQLTIVSSRAVGTTIELRVAARFAYDPEA